MNIAITCKKAESDLKASGLMPRLKGISHLQHVLVRHDSMRGLRFFIREEVGISQHVAWLSETEMREWTNSTIKTYAQFKRKSNEGKIPPKTSNPASSGIHRKLPKTTRRKNSKAAT